MKIAVCLKRVPDTEMRFAIAPDGKSFDPTGLEVAAADELSVIVRTEADAYYSCVVSSPTTCREITIAPEQSMTGRGTKISTPPYTEPPGAVVSMLGLSYMDMGEQGHVPYALLADGSVWVL